MVEEYNAVRRCGPRVRGRLAVLVSLLALTGMAASSRAAAAVAPDLSLASLHCADDNAGSLRAGDALTCSLIAALTGGTENGTVTATIALPDVLDVDALQPPPVYDSMTRVIAYGPTLLGFTFSGDQRVVTFHLVVAAGLDVGTPIPLTAHVKVVGEQDSVVVERDVDAPAMAVAPPPAALDASAIACSDDNGATLLPGENVTCQLDVTNAAGHEDAGSVSARMSFPGAWVSGGANVTTSATSFSDPPLGAIAAEATKSATATFAVSPTALGGDLVFATASILGVSTPSGAPVSLSRLSPPLVVSPGPARLTASALTCTDTNEGILLPGDDVTCNVVVAPSTGYEDVQGAAATVQIPAHAAYVSGADAHDASSLTLASSTLGDVAAGASKSAPFHLQVAPGTTPGTKLQPTGSITATSVPLGGVFQQSLIGTFLIVGETVVVPAEPAATPVTAPVVTPIVVPVAAPAAKGYKLRAKTIRFVMRSAHRRGIHVWKGSKRRFAFVKKFVVRTPSISGKVVRKVSVPKKGKWAPKRGKVKIRGTRLTYTLKKGVSPGKVRDRFHYTIVDTHGKKVTGTVIVSHKKS